jgi:hypothetical protein
MPARSRISARARRRSLRIGACLLVAPLLAYVLAWAHLGIGITIADASRAATVPIRYVTLAPPQKPPPRIDTYGLGFPIRCMHLQVFAWQEPGPPAAEVRSHNGLYLGTLWPFPTAIWRPQFAVNWLLLAAGIYALWTGPEVIRRARRRSDWSCQNCGYSLRAYAHRCPECGERQ